MLGGVTIQTPWEKRVTCREREEALTSSPVGRGKIGMGVPPNLNSYWAVSDLDSVRYVDEGGQWSGLTTLVMVEGERRMGGKTTVESRYYISSLPNDASKLLDAVRSHWGIENKLHWSLDVTFNEDGSRVRSGNGAENVSVAAAHGAESAEGREDNQAQPRRQAKRCRMGQ